MHVVIGLGVTGWSVVRFLCEHAQPVHVMDTRLEPPFLQALRETYPDVPCTLGELSESVLLAADEISVSPGVSLALPALKKARENGVSIIGDIELFGRYCQGEIVAITGTNGKSTVTELVGEMAKEAGWSVAVGGNLGRPALDLLKEHAALYVLELSSFQLEALHPFPIKAGVVLNVSPDHLDRHGTLENYRRIKAKIYDHATHAIVNREEQALAPFATVSFGLDAPQEGQWGVVDHTFSYGNEPILPCHQWPFSGKAHRENALAALALGQAIGLPLDAMCNALKAFKGLPHRCEPLGVCQGVHWYNDSKATNVGACVAAIQSVSEHGRNIILLLGGLAKENDFSLLYGPVEKNVKMVVTYGQDGGLIAESLQHLVLTHRVETLEQAVLLSQQLAQPGELVLFSPACASFDQFENYAKRGECFAEYVKKYQDEG